MVTYVHLINNRSFQNEDINFPGRCGALPAGRGSGKPQVCSEGKAFPSLHLFPVYATINQIIKPSGGPHMPMIEAKVTMQLPSEKRDILKSEFGKAITIMGKPESYLMINLVDNQDLYFGGNKLDKGAYVEVKVLGSVDSGVSDKMTARVCEILQNELGIPGNAVYVSYWGTSNWGWNGGNF